MELPDLSGASAAGHRHERMAPALLVESLQAQAFADLSEQLTGARLRRIVAIAQLPQPEKETELQNFEQRISPAIAALPPAHQVLLRRRLEERLSWARTHEP
ncbi:hypothetical protein QP028_05125 [Corynebacterium suedekumii]|nr:hypothetical protein QP028_05125 [Corynebacterium suedekumii]